MSTPTPPTIISAWRSCKLCYFCSIRNYEPQLFPADGEKLHLELRRYCSDFLSAWYTTENDRNHAPRGTRFRSPFARRTCRSRARPPRQLARLGKLFRRCVHNAVPKPLSPRRDPGRLRHPLFSRRSSPDAPRLAGTMMPIGHRKRIGGLGWGLADAQRTLRPSGRPWDWSRFWRVLIYRMWINSAGLR